MAKKELKINLYRNIAITFIVFAGLLVVAMILFFSSKAAIIITAEKQEVKLSFNAQIKKNADVNEVSNQDIISGYLEVNTKSGEKSFSVLSTKTVSASETVGLVELVNSSNSDQPLLKTTQLEAAGGVIVRTSEAVVVPAGGEVTVGVYPKDPATFTAVAPGRLTIVKLNKSLQDEIYGLAGSKLSSEPREVKVLATGDMERAKEELAKELVAAARKEMNLTEENKIVSAVTESSLDKKIGDETDKFTLKMTVEVKALKVDEDQLADLILRKVGNLNLTGLTVEKINVADVDYLIINEDEAGGAMVKVNYVLETKIAENNSLLDPNNFLGQTIENIKSTLSQNELIKEVDVILSPYWRQSLPNKAEKIKVIIK